MATPQVRQFKITFKNIKEGELTCDSPIVKIFDLAPNVLQKCEFKNNSVYFSIYEDAIEGLQGTCIQFSVVCESCGKCPQKNGQLCFCNNFTDCDDCQDCINGVCVNRCPDMLCIDGKCQNCGTNTDCKNNLSCIGGKCTCPPTLPYYDEVAEKCYGCQTDAECPPCYRCIDGNCVRLNCVCNEDLDQCVECNQSSDCPLPNQICKNNKCECAPGYIWDPTIGECVIEPECTSDDDCEDPCKICVNGACVDIICPDPNEVCTDGVCGPIPCEGPCDDATDCGPDCGCLDGVCVDCASLDCLTCAQTIGCKCVTGDCVKDDSPCAQYSCDTNCGDRPDCGCAEDGEHCEEVACDGESTLAKNEDECKLEYNLETTKCCVCSDITIDNKFISAQASGTGSIKLNSSVEVRKGSVTNPLGILNIHRVDEDQYDDIMDNEEATQGVVRVTAKYTYEGISGGNPNGIFTTETITLSPTFDLASVGFNTQALYIFAPGSENPTGIRIVRSVVLTYTLISELTFESGCVYSQDQIIGSYTFDDSITKTALIAKLNIDTPGQNSNVDYWIAKTVTSDTCRNPEARWYKAAADTNGAITTFETVPFRKSYLTKLTPTTYTDFIDEPDENPGPTDNNGELFSGYYYKVATDCACTNEAVAYYESTCQNPGRLVFCDPQVANITFDPCGKKITFNESFITDCLPNYDYYGDNADFVPDDAQLRYSIYVNGSSTPLSGSTKIADINGLIYNSGQMFTSTELIQYIEIKWSHDNCDECTIRINSDVDLDLPSYSVICVPSGVSNTTYIITFTGWTNITSVTVNSNVATSGSPTVSVTVINGTTSLTGLVAFTGCPGTVSMNIQLPENCCDDLEVSLSQDINDCDGATYDFIATASPAVPGTFSFSVNGVFAESNTDGLFSTNKNIGGNEPNTISVSFNPDADGCNTVVNSIEVDKTNMLLISSDRDDTNTICGGSTEFITFATIGYTGSVTYTVTGDGTTTETLDGTVDLTISVDGVVDDTKFITFTDVTLQDENGNTCVAFDPTVTTFMWVDEPDVTSITIDPIEGCEGDAVTFVVNGTGSTATVSLTNFLGVTPTTVNIGQTYTVYLGSSTNDGIITATAAHAGDCDAIVNVGASVNILDAPEIMDFEYVCQTPGNPSSDIDVTVTGTAGAVATVAADEGNVVLTESPAGVYTGTIAAANGGNSVTVTMVIASCSTDATYDIIACGCDPGASVQIKLGGIAITSDSGCVDETSNYTSTIAGGNAPFNYEWRLDNAVSGTLLGTSSSLTPYTFIVGTHTLYLVVTDDEGCTFQDSITVIGAPLPTATVVGDSTPCQDEANVYSVSFTNGPVSSYQWYLDAVATVTTATYSYTPVDASPHDITVVIINSNGCQSAESAALTVTAVDCCELCDGDVFLKDAVAYNRLRDVYNNVYNISGPGVLSGNGAFTSVTFECVDSPNPSTQNDDAVLDLQEAIEGLLGQCGTPAVSWDYGASGDATDCLSESFNVTSGTSGIWFQGFEVNGNTYAGVNFKIANASAGLLTNPIPTSGAEQQVLTQLEYALNQEGVGCISKTVKLTGTAGTATLAHGIEIVGITGTTVKYIYSTTSAGTQVLVDINDTTCGAIVGGTTNAGGCVKVSIANNSIFFSLIYPSASGPSGSQAVPIVGSCNPS